MSKRILLHVTIILPLVLASCSNSEPSSQDKFNEIGKRIAIATKAYSLGDTYTFCTEQRAAYRVFYTINQKLLPANSDQMKMYGLLQKSIKENSANVRRICGP